MSEEKTVIALVADTLRKGDKRLLGHEGSSFMQPGMDEASWRFDS